MLTRIRALFSAAGLLEVDTPSLSPAGNPDPAIDSFCTVGNGQALYLHTSPEFPMKRLLAAGSGDIYQICKVFRQGESGRNHNPEFTLLEWYRLGIDHHQLMQETAQLVNTLAAEAGHRLQVEKITYQALFQRHFRLDPLDCSAAQLQGIARDQGIDLGGDTDLDRDQWLDLLISHGIMPTLAHDQLTLLYDYPASQASLARLNPDGRTAARFEVFWGGLELANGFHELQNPAEQLARFDADNQQRLEQQQAPLPVDHKLIAALEHGLPQCSGVALGVDRLLMKLLGKQRVEEVMAFAGERA